MLVKMLRKSSLFFLHCKTCLLSNYPIKVSYKFTCLALPKTILLLPNGMLSLIKSCLIHITQNKADHCKYHDTFQWYNNIQISRGGVHRRKEKILPLVLKQKLKSFLPRRQMYNKYTCIYINDIFRHFAHLLHKQTGIVSSCSVKKETMPLA